MKTYTFAELVEFYNSLPPDTVFENDYNNEEGRCGCLLTQFFRSRQVEFSFVGMANAHGWHGLAAKCVSEDEEKINSLIHEFLVCFKGKALLTKSDIDDKLQALIKQLSAA